MENFLKYKNRIVVGISVILVVIFSIFIFGKFFLGNNFKTKIDFSENIGKYGVINDDLYVFNNTNLVRYSKNGKLKVKKEFSSSGNVKVGNDVIYALNGKELILLNNSFEEVKRIKVEGSNLDFFVEGNNAVVVGDDLIHVYDSTLNLKFEEKIKGNVIYSKFSKNRDIILYTDYVEYKDGFKSRYNVVNLKDKKVLNGFTLFNELILDAGFLSTNTDDIYVLTTEKVYIFKGSVIKGTHFVSNLKDFKVKDGKIYLLSDKVEILSGEDLKVERVINFEESYNRINILKSEVILSNSSGYMIVNKKDEAKTYNENILDVIQNEDGLYFVLQDGFMKLR